MKVSLPLRCIAAVAVLLALSSFAIAGETRRGPIKIGRPPYHKIYVESPSAHRTSDADADDGGEEEESSSCPRIVDEDGAVLCELSRSSSTPCSVAAVYLVRLKNDERLLAVDLRNSSEDEAGKAWRFEFFGYDKGDGFHRAGPVGPGETGGYFSNAIVRAPKRENVDGYFELEDGNRLVLCRAAAAFSLAYSSLFNPGRYSFDPVKRECYPVVFDGKRKPLRRTIESCGGTLTLYSGPGKNRRAKAVEVEKTSEIKILGGRLVKSEPWLKIVVDRNAGWVNEESFALLGYK